MVEIIEVKQSSSFGNTMQDNRNPSPSFQIDEAEPSPSSSMNAPSRSKSAKFLRFMDKKKRVKSDPDGISSSLSLRTKVHLDRAKKLVESGRPASAQDEPTVNIDETNVPEPLENQPEVEEKQKHQSLFARKKSLVQRFEERDTSRCLTPLITQYLKKEAESAQTNEQVEKTGEHAPKVQKNLAEALKEIKMKDDESIEEYDILSIQWDTQTVIQEQTRIRGILESRLGPRLVKRTKEAEVNIDTETRAAFFVEAKDRMMMQMKDSANDAEDEGGETTVHEAESPSNSASEEDIVVLKPSDEMQVEDEVASLKSAEQLEDDHETEVQLDDEQQIDNEQQIDDEQQIDTRSNMSQSKNSNSDIDEGSIKSKDVMQAATSLRPIFEELRLLSTRAIQSGRFNQGAMAEKETETEMTDAVMSYVDVPENAVDPPTAQSSRDLDPIVSTSVSEPNAILLQNSLSTYDYSTYDRYAATVDLSDDETEKDINLSSSTIQTKLDEAEIIVPSVGDLYNDKVTDKLNEPFQNEIQKLSLGDPYNHQVNEPFQNENEEPGVGNLYDNQVNEQIQNRVEAPVPHEEVTTILYPQQSVQNLRFPAEPAIVSKGTDLDSIAEMVMTENAYKERLRATSRSPPPQDRPESASVGGNVHSQKQESNNVSSTNANGNSPPDRSFHAISTSFQDESRSYVSGSSRSSLSGSRDSRGSYLERSSRSRSVPRSISSKSSNSSNREQQSMTKTRRLRSVSPARSRSDFEEEAQKSRSYRRVDSFDNSPKNAWVHNNVPLPPPPPSTPRSARVRHVQEAMPPRPKTSTGQGVREWFVASGREPNFKNLADDASLESTGLNTLENDFHDDKSTVCNSVAASFDECRDPPEGKDPPGKIRIEGATSKSFRPSSRQSSRASVKLPEPAGRNLGKVIEEEPPSSRRSSRSLNRKDKAISPKGRSSSCHSTRSIKREDKGTSPRARSSSRQSTRPLVKEEVSLSRAPSSTRRSFRREDRSERSSRRSIPLSRKEPPIRSNRLTIAVSPPKLREPIMSMEDPIMMGRSMDLSEAPVQKEPPAMIIETNFTEDSTALSSTVETLEAENRNLKSQLASMMELLEETDASVAYLQEALKRDETTASQPKTHRSKRKPTSYRRSRQKPVHRSAE